MRGPDLNQRPSGYEPDELPDCSTPRLKDVHIFIAINLKKVNIFFQKNQRKTFSCEFASFAICGKTLPVVPISEAMAEIPYF